MRFLAQCLALITGVAGLALLLLIGDAYVTTDVPGLWFPAALGGMLVALALLFLWEDMRG